MCQVYTRVPVTWHAPLKSDRFDKVIQKYNSRNNVNETVP